MNLLARRLRRLSDACPYFAGGTARHFGRGPSSALVSCTKAWLVKLAWLDGISDFAGALPTPTETSASFPTFLSKLRRPMMVDDRSGHVSKSVARLPVPDVAKVMREDQRTSSVEELGNV